MKTNKSFEATYPRYPFAGLVRLGIALAKFFRGLDHSGAGKTPAAHNNNDALHAVG